MEIVKVKQEGWNEPPNPWEAARAEQGKVMGRDPLAMTFERLHRLQTSTFIFWPKVLREAAWPNSLLIARRRPGGESCGMQEKAGAVMTLEGSC